MPPLQEILFLLAAGALTGILSGLLGIGGGLIIVPIMLWLLQQHAAPPEQIMQIALGTALATIAFTSIASARAHHRHGNVNWGVVSRIAPGIVLGALIGAWVAAGLPSDLLKWVFIVFAGIVGTQLLLDYRPAPGRQLPGSNTMFASGTVIGAFSSLVGIGGGSLSVPFLTYCNRPMREAVGTSAAIGFPIAVAGTLGYILSGLHSSGLPAYSLGFVYLPGAIGITLASTLTAGFGAKLAQRLPAATLKRYFGILLYVLALKMAAGLL